jgi:hypothetical protein
VCKEEEKMPALRGFKSVFYLTALLVAPAIASAGDRPPTAEERNQIETALRAAGYTTWEEIEFDDGMWEVDDARKGNDNREFDLKLDPKTYKITMEREDR